VFDSVADLYDSRRPGYPEPMFDDLVALAGVPSGGELLEVGPGTGQATLPLVRRGLRVVALEPGANLAAVLRRKMAGLPVEVVETTLEAWQPGERRFDVVASGTAFHWVDAETRYASAHGVLRRGGSLAVFWNEHISTADTRPAFDALQDAYREFAPRPTDEYHLPRPDEIRDRTDEIEESGFFTAVERRRYEWTTTYSTGEYVGLLATYSPQIAQPEADRRRFLDAIAATIDTELRGRIVKPYLTDLYVARAVER